MGEFGIFGTDQEDKDTLSPPVEIAQAPTEESSVPPELVPVTPAPQPPAEPELPTEESSVPPELVPASAPPRVTPASSVPPELVPVAPPSPVPSPRRVDPPAVSAAPPSTATPAAGPGVGVASEEAPRVRIPPQHGAFGADPAAQRKWLEQFKAPGMTPDVQNLADRTVHAASQFAALAKKAGFQVSITSGKRETSYGSLHESGLAVDVRMVRADGKPMSGAEEVAAVKDLAERAGFVTMGDEIHHPSSRATGPHLHLSMEQEAVGAKGWYQLRQDRTERKFSSRTEQVETIARSAGIDRPDLLIRQFRQESGLDEKAVSPAGAEGIAQFMPGTLAEVAKKYGYSVADYKNDPVVQMRLGALHMRDLLEKHGNWAHALAAYNAGDGGLADMQARGVAYPETRDYVAKILGVSPEEATKLITGSGGSYRYDAGAAKVRHRSDVNAVVEYAGNFATSFAENADLDLAQGGREFLAGVTFGLTELLPWTKATDRWAKLKEDTSWVGTIGLELPRLAGIALTSELLAGALGAATFAQMPRALQATVEIRGLRTLHTAAMKSLTRGIAAGKTTSAMGRLFLGEFEMFSSAMIYSGVAGMQAGIETAVTKMKDPSATAEDVVKSAFANALYGSAIGLFLGLAVPGTIGLGLLGINKLRPTARALGEATNPLRLFPDSVQAKIAPVLNAAGAPQAVTGAVVGAGASMLTEEHDTGELMLAGALAGVSARQLWRAVPAHAKAKVEEGVAQFWDTLDEQEKRFMTAQWMDAVGQFGKNAHAVAQEDAKAFMIKTTEDSTEALRLQIKVQERELKRARARKKTLERAIPALEQAKESAMLGNLRKLEAWENFEAARRRVSDIEAERDVLRNIPKEERRGHKVTYKDAEGKDVTVSYYGRVKMLAEEYTKAKQARDLYSQDPDVLSLLNIESLIAKHKAELADITGSDIYKKAAKIEETVLGMKQFIAWAEKYKRMLQADEIDPGIIPGLPVPSWDFGNNNKYLKEVHASLAEAMRAWSIKMSQMRAGGDDLTQHAERFIRTLVDPAEVRVSSLAQLEADLNGEILKITGARKTWKDRNGKVVRLEDVTTPDIPVTVASGSKIPVAVQRESVYTWSEESYNTAREWQRKSGKYEYVWVETDAVVSHLERNEIARSATDKTYVATQARLRKMLDKGDDVDFPVPDASQLAYVDTGTETIRLSARDEAFATLAKADGQRYIPIAVKKGAGGITALKKVLAAERRQAKQELLSALQAQHASVKAALSQMQGGFSPGTDQFVGARNPMNLQKDKVMEGIIKQKAWEKIAGPTRRFSARKAYGTPQRKEAWDAAVKEARRDFNMLKKSQQKALVRAEIEDLMSLFDNRLTPSGYAYEKFVDPRGVDAIDPDQDLGVMASLRALVESDHDVGQALLSVVGRHGADTPLRWGDEVFGVTKQIAADDLVNGTQASAIVEEHVKETFAAAFKSALEARGKTATAAQLQDLHKEFAWAVEDPKLLAKFLNENKDMRPVVDSFLRIKTVLEEFALVSPQLRGYTTAMHLNHRYPNMMKFARAQSFSDEARKTTTLANELSRKIPTYKQAEEFTRYAHRQLDEMGVTVEQWISMPVENRVRLATELAIAKGVSREKLAQNVTLGILLDSPINDPGELLASQLSAVMRAQGTRRFLEALNSLWVDTGVKGNPYARVLHILPDAGGRTTPVKGAPGKITGGSATSKHIADVPRTLARYKSGLSGKKVVSGNVPEDEVSGALQSYVMLDQVPGCEHMAFVGPNGETISASRMAVHPDAADFIGNYLMSAGAKSYSSVWQQLAGLVRTLTLSGSPLPHIFNVSTAVMTSFATSFLRAFGLSKGNPSMIFGAHGAGRMIEGMVNEAGQEIGRAMLVNAVRHGLNLRTMRQSTHLMTQETMAAMDPRMVETLYGSRKGIERFLASIDPTDPAQAMMKDQLGKGARFLSDVLGIPFSADYALNRYMLFDSIQKAQLAAFHYHATEIYQRYEKSLGHLSNGLRWRYAQQAAADKVNILAGALPYYYQTDKVRRVVYATLLTPSWAPAKAHEFLAALDGAGVAAGKRSWFAHLPEEARKQAVGDAAKIITGGIIAFVMSTQVANYLINGKTTLDHSTDKIFHVMVGDKAVNSPLFGFFRDIAKGVGGSVAERSIEPFLRTLTNQLNPILRSGLDVASNRNPVTGDPIYRPGGDMTGQALDIFQHLVYQLVNIEDTAGVEEGATPLEIFGISALGTEGIKRMEGREWLLRQFGVWERDYNAPMKANADYNKRKAYYTGKHEGSIRALAAGIARAANPEEYSTLKQEIVRRALHDGIDVSKDRVLKKYIPHGRLTMTPERLVEILEDEALRADPMKQSLTALAKKGKRAALDPSYRMLIDEVQAEISRRDRTKVEQFWHR